MTKQNELILEVVNTIEQSIKKHNVEKGVYDNSGFNDEDSVFDYDSVKIVESKSLLSSLLNDEFYNYEYGQLEYDLKQYWVDEEITDENIEIAKAIDKSHKQIDQVARDVNEMLNSRIDEFEVDKETAIDSVVEIFGAILGEYTSAFGIGENYLENDLKNINVTIPQSEIIK